MKDCRAAGITATIIPGLMPILGYDRFQRTINFCKTNVPEQLSKDLEAIKNDDEKVRQYGVDHGVQMCRELMAGGCKFLHFYTMNLEAAIIKVIQGLGIMKKGRALPFMAGTSAERSSESVRPIFWANKPMSYNSRTLKWDEFPNGRWGDSKSPAFGGGMDDAEGAGFVSYSKKFKTTNLDEKRKNWGNSCTSLADVSKVFTAYITGKIKKFPFSEGALALETSQLTDILEKMNAAKMLTINSQPQVNAARSDDAKFGWGPEDGYIYQKAYFEFFVPKELVKPLANYLDGFKTISYQAINMTNDQISNVKETSVNAVTWGVFPGKEVVQPTVVDHQAFEIWKNEALQAFCQTWAVIYEGVPAKSEKDKGIERDQASIDFLKSCQDNLYLMNVVENDFIGGDLSKLMADFIAKEAALIESL